MKIENVNFKKADGTDNTSGAGAFVGKNSATSITHKLVAVAKYHNDVSKIPTADIKTNAGTNSFIVFSDYTDTSADASKRIAYHLYVPVLTKKTVNIEFSAASLSGSEYRMLGYSDKITREIAGGKNANTVNHEGNAATGNVIRATVTSKLNAALIIGDFYRHTVSDFNVTSALNSQIITEANKVLTTTSTATISLIDNEEHTQAAYFANVLSNAEHLYHSFNLQMIRSNSVGKNDDIIKGIEKNNISATYGAKKHRLSQQL